MPAATSRCAGILTYGNGLSFAAISAVHRAVAPQCRWGGDAPAKLGLAVRRRRHRALAAISAAQVTETSAG
jgi:hypothetical protein